MQTDALAGTSPMDNTNGFDLFMKKPHTKAKQLFLKNSLNGLCKIIKRIQNERTT